MSDIGPIGGPSHIPPAEPLRGEMQIKQVAKQFQGDIDALILELKRMDSNSPKDPAQVEAFQKTINRLHADALQATDGICTGCPEDMGTKSTEPRARG